METTITITEKDLDKIEAEIISKFKEIENQKYITSNLFIAVVSKAFKSFRDKSRTSLHN